MSKTLPCGSRYARVEPAACTRRATRESARIYGTCAKTQLIKLNSAVLWVFGHHYWTTHWESAQGWRSCGKAAESAGAIAILVCTLSQGKYIADPSHT